MARTAPRQRPLAVSVELDNLYKKIPIGKMLTELNHNIKVATKVLIYGILCSLVTNTLGILSIKIISYAGIILAICTSGFMIIVSLLILIASRKRLNKNHMLWGIILLSGTLNMIFWYAVIAECGDGM